MIGWKSWKAPDMNSSLFPGQSEPEVTKGDGPHHLLYQWSLPQSHEELHLAKATKFSLSLCNIYGIFSHFHCTLQATYKTLRF